ncbi:glycerophosphodiester phosphodiesterase [Neiella sp. HB171785]|uniref:glycerophosphodiester phosphodiesterase n=1 Tax=Neiella litorisoli TaxID=2771431 RepID=A0A8J6QTH3_9GAMM|nr:glycerophosphodiester phosphodiesterase [Neiella litorisoli]MBD1390604.1 glycerophosphodiester phosphodiesterase [Neiella litorisoli]
MKIAAKYIAWILLLSAPMVHAIDVIAHRGASGLLPEHSLVAVAYAHAAGADYIEQDVVMSRDGVAVVLHDIHLDTTTDVATKYPNRARANGRFYAIDFDLAELKTLELHERVDHQSKHPEYPMRFPVKHLGLRIATFAEHIELIQGLNHSTGHTVGIYPEIKAPKWHREQGQDISKQVLAVLNQYGYNARHHKVFVQCFDANELRRIRHQLGSKLKLVQLLGENSWQLSTTDYDWLKTPEGMADVASYADGIGPWWPQLVDNQQQPSALASHAKAQQLIVHPYTFRADQLPSWAESYQQWLRVFIATVKVDGLFTDFPRQTVQISQQLDAANP